MRESDSHYRYRLAIRRRGLTVRPITSGITFTFGWIRENVALELLRHRHPEGVGKAAVDALKAVMLDGMLAIVLADEHVQATAC